MISLFGAVGDIFIYLIGSSKTYFNLGAWGKKWAVAGHPQDYLAGRKGGKNESIIII